MTEWEYYYLDETDGEDGVYESGLFQLKRADIDEDNPFDETVSFGKINLDFKDGEIAGIEIYDDASSVISPVWREGTIENPENFSVDERRESESLIDKLKDKDVL